MNKFIFAIIMVLILVICGTIGYTIIEKWNILDSFYMTVITISTVGFREVANLSTRGRIFTMLMIILGIGIGGYTIGNITAFIVEGQIQNIFKGKKMDKLLNSLRNHIIICGYGRTGDEISDVLAETGKDFVIIDNNDERLGEARRSNYLTISGDATDDDILIKAGVNNAHSLIAALGNDADNVYVVLTARGLNANLRIIARGIDENSARKLKMAGANKVVSPFSIAGRRMAYLASKPDIVEFLEIMTQSAELELRLEQVIIHKNSSLAKKRLNQSNIKSLTDGAMIIGIKKCGTEKMKINPHGDTELEEGDILIALGNDKQMKLLKDLVS